MTLASRSQIVREHWAPLAAAAVVLAVGGVSVWAAPFRLDTDDVTYLGLAANHAAGAGLTVPGEIPATGWQFPPGWPLLLSWLFAAGLNLRAVTWCASALNAVCLAGAAAIWASIFSRRVGSVWALLAALWGALAFPTLLAGTSASAEGAASLLTALLALLVMSDRPADSLPSARRAGALGLAMAAVALLRTQLLLLWPLALWHARSTLNRRQRAAALILAAALTLAVTRLVAVRVSGTGYLPSTLTAWQGGLASVGADTLRHNLTANLWNGVTSLTASPLPYSGFFRRTAGRLGMHLVTATVCLGLLWAAWRERGRSLPVLAGAPLALMLPFVAGFPYAMTPRFLVPAAPILGYLAIACLRRVLGSRQRLAMAMAGLWLLLGVAWWAHLAPRYRATQEGVLSDARRVVDDLRQRRGGVAPLCAEMPEALWAASADVRACRLVTTVEYLLRPAPRDSAVRARLLETGARCIVAFTPLEARGDAQLPLVAWGYRPALRTTSFSTWCRT